ncbi:MAG: ATP-binding protein [Caldilineaceae bacterium]
MKSEVAQQILSDQPIAYAVTDRTLRIVELGDSPALFGQPQNVERGKLLFDFAPELIGHEQDIDDILNGEIQRFEIPLVNREVEPGKVIYTTLVNLPYVKSGGEIAGILHIVEDVSSQALTEQKMLQQRNELYILQDELRKQNQKLSAAIAELQRVDELKSSFISIAAHELRNPIVTILLYARMLLEDEAEALSQKHLSSISVIYRNADRLIWITNNLLDLVRLDAGQIELVIKPTDLLEIVTKAEADIQPLLNEKRQKLHITKEEEIPLVLCDEGRMLQILNNLLHNASKYSANGSEITVHLKLAETPNCVQISVVDRGIGIPQQEQARLFERFFRASNAYSSNVAGSGLGLSIVQSLVKLHSGRIWLESEAGRGTTVHLQFHTDTN